MRSSKLGLLWISSIFLWGALGCGDVELDESSSEDELKTRGQAVYNGSPDLEAKYHAVVSLGGACTGTIFKQEGTTAWVLTAAHCMGALGLSPPAGQWQEYNPPRPGIYVGVSSGVYKPQCEAYNVTNPSAPVLPCDREASYFITGAWRKNWGELGWDDIALLRVEVPQGVTLPVMPLWTDTHNDPNAAHPVAQLPYMMAGFGRQDFYNFPIVSSPPASQGFPITNDGRRHYGAHKNQITYTDQRAFSFKRNSPDEGASVQPGDSGGALIMRKGCADYVVGALSAYHAVGYSVSVLYGMPSRILDVLSQEPLASLVGDLTPPDPVELCGHGKILIKPWVSAWPALPETGSFEPVPVGQHFYSVAEEGKSRVAPIYEGTDADGRLSGRFFPTSSPLQEMEVMLPTQGQRYTVTLDPLVWRDGQQVRYFVAEPVYTGDLYLRDGEVRTIQVRYREVLQGDAEDLTRPGDHLEHVGVALAETADDVLMVTRRDYSYAEDSFVDTHLLRNPNAQGSYYKSYDLLIKSKLQDRLTASFHIPAAQVNSWSGNPTLRVDGDTAVVCVADLHCHIFAKSARPYKEGGYMLYVEKTSPKMWHYLGPWRFFASFTTQPYGSFNTGYGQLSAALDVRQVSVSALGDPELELAVAPQSGFGGIGMIFQVSGVDAVPSLPSAFATRLNAAKELFMLPSSTLRGEVSINAGLLAWSHPEQKTVYYVKRAPFSATTSRHCYKPTEATATHTSCVSDTVANAQVGATTDYGRVVGLSKTSWGKKYGLLMGGQGQLDLLTVQASLRTPPVVVGMLDVDAFVQDQSGATTSSFGRGWALGHFIDGLLPIAVGDPNKSLHGMAWTLHVDFNLLSPQPPQLQEHTPSALTTGAHASFGEQVSVYQTRTRALAPNHRTSTYSYGSKVYEFLSAPLIVCAPSPEVCDGVDNDCDGLVDEDGVCTPVCVPSAEVCDGVDNDCDGLVDEGRVCTIIIPSCESYETCGNGIDDDCNGQIDEFPCLFDDGSGGGFEPSR